VKPRDGPTVRLSLPPRLVYICSRMFGMKAGWPPNRPDIPMGRAGAYI